jgi:hypothetical protein
MVNVYGDVTLPKHAHRSLTKELEQCLNEHGTSMAELRRRPGGSLSQPFPATKKPAGSDSLFSDDAGLR